ncbi:uncharacterized protein LOC122267032 [Penaeus japonicus]|uniref:uncharacterized protein LOC122267032 n=1 Tax=Penaeus japonicus TaxID=27405 RepID=UPI001C715447|nr:uncharacterized protein LOC122267032 [Penaeus japonicus]
MMATPGIFGGIYKGRVLMATTVPSPVLLLTHNIGLSFAMFGLRFMVLLAAVCLTLAMPDHACKHTCQTPAGNYVCCDPPRCPHPAPCIDFNHNYCYRDAQCPPGQKCCRDGCSNRRLCIPV